MRKKNLRHVMSAVAALSQAIALIKSAEATYKHGKRTYKGVRKGYYKGKAAYRAGRTFYKTGSLSKAYSKYKSQRRTDIRAGRGRRLRTLPWREPGRYNIGAGRSTSSSNPSHEGLQIDIQQRPITVPTHTPKFALVNNLSRAERMLFNKYVCRCLQMKEADNNVTTGTFTLDHAQDTGAIPIHVWSLGTIYSDNTNGQAGYELNNNGIPQALSGATMSRISYHGLQGSEGSEVYTGIFRNAMVNLMLYSRSNKSTTYDITFFKLVDDDMDPNISNLGLDGFNNEKCQNFWNPIGLKYTQNPAINAPRYSAGSYQQYGKKRVKVLSRYHYVLREQLSSEDVVHKKVIKFNVRPNSRINWDLGQHGQVTDTDITGDGEIGLGGLQGGNQMSEHPRTKQNIYMSIAATSFKYSDAGAGEDGEGANQPTYDIDFTNVFDVPREYAA